MKEMKLIEMPLCEEKQEYQTPSIQVWYWGIDIECETTMFSPNQDSENIWGDSGWGDDW